MAGKIRPVGSPLHLGCIGQFEKDISNEEEAALGKAGIRARYFLFVVMQS